MPLTRRSEGTKIHLLKAAALRVGFLSAEFRRLNVPPPAPADPITPIGAFIADISLVNNAFPVSLQLDLKPLGGNFPKGTIVLLTLGTNIPEFEKIDIGVVLQNPSTGADAVAALFAKGDPLPSMTYDVGLGPLTTGITVTNLGGGILQYDLVNTVADEFVITSCEINITGGGTTVTYTVS